MEPNRCRDDKDEQALVALLPTLRRLARALTCDSKAADRLVETVVRKASPAEAVYPAMVAAILDCWSAAEDSAARPPSAVDAAMHALPRDQRAAAALVLVEGLAYADAAALLGLPVATLTERLALARAALARSLRA